MKTTMLILVLIGCFGMLGTSSSTKKYTPISNQKYQTLVQEMPSAKLLIQQDKQCDKLMQKMETIEDHVDNVTTQVDCVSVSLDDKKVLRKVKRELRKEEKALANK